MTRRAALRVVIAIAGTLLVVSVVAGVFISLATLQQVRTTQLEGTPTGKRLLEAADQIKSCTNPDGACYQREQRQAGSAVANVNQFALYAAACADRNGEQTVEEIQTCIIRRYAADGATR